MCNKIFFAVISFFIFNLSFSQFVKEDIVAKWEVKRMVYKKDTLDFPVVDKSASKAFFAMIANDRKPGLSGSDSSTNVMSVGMVYGMMTFLKYEFKGNGEFWGLMERKGVLDGRKMGTYKLNGDKLKLNSDDSNSKDAEYTLVKKDNIIYLMINVDGVEIYYQKF